MNLFMIEINGRKILNKLYSELDKISKTETMYMQTLKIARDIKEYILSLEYEADYSLEFETELDVPGLLKIAGVKYEETEIDFEPIYQNNSKGIVNKSDSIYKFAKLFIGNTNAGSD